jgi:hypothetical protein
MTYTLLATSCKSIADAWRKRAQEWREHSTEWHKMADNEKDSERRQRFEREAFNCGHLASELERNAANWEMRRFGNEARAKEYDKI